MKLLVSIVAFCALAFAQNPQTQSPEPTQPAQTPQAQPVVAPMPYPNQATTQSIIAKIQQMYPGAFITDMDYEGWGYEVEINDSLELFFDNNGNFLGQKWD